MLLIIIGIISSLSYVVGIKAILQGKYKPNVYSRIIWFLLAANALTGILLLDSDAGVIALSIVQTLGSLLMMLFALKHAKFTFGVIESIATALLALSLSLWLFADLPALNVAISLVAHFIGGIPTLIRLFKQPTAENPYFWGWFAVASYIAVAFADLSSFENYMFPLYFGLYNTVIVLLSLRRYSKAIK